MVFGLMKFLKLVDGFVVEKVRPDSNDFRL